jgi:hypothetical protein
MKVAYVEVSWPDGARRDHVSLTYLLTNNKALDEFLLTKKNIFDGVIKKMAGANAPQLATGPACTASDPPGSISIPGGGGCTHPGGITRRPDGSLYDVNGGLISGPAAATPPVPPSGNPPGMPNPGAGGMPPVSPGGTNP